MPSRCCCTHHISDREGCERPPVEPGGAKETILLAASRCVLGSESDEQACDDESERRERLQVGNRVVRMEIDDVFVVECFDEGGYEDDASDYDEGVARVVALLRRIVHLGSCSSDRNIWEGL